MQAAPRAADRLGSTLSEGFDGVERAALLFEVGEGGTRVALYYRGRTITVPVIDRGPYGPADYDLTGATARALHFDGRATIGANPLSHRTG